MSETTQFVSGPESRLHTVSRAPITKIPSASVVEARFVPAVPAQRTAAAHELSAAQRNVLSLFACDLIIVLLSAMAVAIIQSNMDVGHRVALLGWECLWLICTAVVGGFSTRRDTSLSGAFVMKSGFLTVLIGTASMSIIAPYIAAWPYILLGLSLATAAYAVRIVYRKLSSLTVIAVTEAGAANPVPSERGTTVRHLTMSEETLGDVDRVIENIEAVASDYDATCVVITRGVSLSDEAVLSLCWALRTKHVSLRFAGSQSQVRPSRLHPVVSPNSFALEIAPPLQPVVGRMAKRMIDVFVSAVLLVLLSPLLVVLAIVVSFSGPGGIFFRQERIGKDGEPFNILKFRTMVDGADSGLRTLLAEQHKEETPLFKVANDPRITSVGRAMRKYSLDELPQLFNVLAGSMSLVGPRPQCADEVALYSGNTGHRLGVLPGMTGLWQVSGRSDMAWEDAQHLDIYYAHNWSVWQDFKILLKTIRAVVRADGAC